HRVFYARLPLPQHATLLPYTTLFRSHSREHTSRSDRGEFVHRVYVPPIERPGVATFLFSGIKWVNGSHKGSDDTAPNVERHAARLFARSTDRPSPQYTTVRDDVTDRRRYLISLLVVLAATFSSSLHRFRDRCFPTRNRPCRIG